MNDWYDPFAAKNILDEYALAILTGIYANPNYKDMTGDKIIKAAFDGARACLEERDKRLR